MKPDEQKQLVDALNKLIDCGLESLSVAKSDKIGRKNTDKALLDACRDAEELLRALGLGK